MVVPLSSCSNKHLMIYFCVCLPLFGTSDSPWAEQERLCVAVTSMILSTTAAKCVFI